MLLSLIAFKVLSLSLKNISSFIEKALAIEAQEAKDAGALGFMGRALVQATMPHRKVLGNEFVRKNGAFTLSILSPSDVGLPYGSIPRLLVAWITTEAVRTKQRELILGRSLSEFMAHLDLVPTGGRWGSITRLKTQMSKLFASSISCTYSDGDHWAIRNVNPVSHAELWWSPKQPHQAAIFESSLALNEDFFNEITTYPVPIDLRVLKALKRSPLALDIYCWTTYRVSYLKKNTLIPWEVLQMQFGSNYANTSQGVRNFKRHFLKELKKVLCVYGALNAEEEKVGLLLKPSRAHIKKANGDKFVK